MTPERAKELLPVITAFAEGKRIEFRPHHSLNWLEVGDIYFTDPLHEYRIAPDPPQTKWRAWKISEIREIFLRERLVVVSKRGTECTQEIVAVSGFHIRLGNDGLILPEALYNGYERADGSPCGVME